MKTKNLFFLLTLFAALSVSAQDSAVVINGVRWATRNVDAPGTFAKNPEDAGMFYQWNSKEGWPATGAIDSITACDGSTKWNSNWNGGYAIPSDTDTWIYANDPSPVNYRVPTYDEIKTLFDTNKVTRIWISQNYIYGERFTDKTTGNSIFLPASGLRYDHDGTLDNAGSYGYYWMNSSKFDLAYYLRFGGGIANAGSLFRASGFTIRPVAE